MEAIIIEEKKVASNVAWNTVGSLFYFACQWLLSVVVVRLSDGYEDAGILSLAISVTNIFATIALFNVRNYQVSDTDGEYTSTEYSTHRLMTCGIAFIGCVGFALINAYSFYITASIIGYMFVKLIEAYADVLHGMAQNKWRLDIAGKSYIMRGVLLILSFSLTEYFTANLAFAIAAMAVTNVFVLIFYDFRLVRRIDIIGFRVTSTKMASLSLKCLPLLIYGLCTNSIVSGARYFIEMMHGEEALGYYATVSTVAVLVQAMVTLIFTPLIGVFNEAYKSGDKRAVTKLLMTLVALLLGITAVALVAIFFLGDFAMTLIFGEEIRPYVYLLYPTVIASCITAFMWLMGMLLVVMRDTVTLMIGAIVGITVSVALCIILIPGTCYTGANVAIIVSLSLISVIYTVRFIAYLLTGRN